MARAVRSILASIVPGDEYSLRAAADALHESLMAPPPPPDDPAEAIDQVDVSGAELAGTWQEVRAARDFGDLSEHDYEFLATAMDALTVEV